MIDKPENYPNERFLWPSQVLPELRLWIESLGIDPMHVNAAGKNFGSFDKQFLKKLDPKQQVLKFRHRSFDPGELFIQKDDEFIPGTEECLKRAGVPPVENVHRADPDARQVIRLLRAHYCPQWGIAI